jgi:prolyl oligopeptidase
MSQISITKEKDPYLWLEDLSDEKVVSWALEKDAKFRKQLKPHFPNLSKRITKYYNVRTILQVKVTKRGTFFLERRLAGYIIRLGKRILADSRDFGKDYLFFAFYTDEAGNRLAYFVSKGEDTGLLRIIQVKNRKLIAELKGDVQDVTFAKKGFYYSRFFKEGITPDGVQPPTSRIMKGEELVFGKDVPSGVFVGLKESHGFALASVGTWSKTAIYSGRLEKPKSWKKIFGGNYLSTPLGYIQGKGALILAYDGGGNGRIFLGKRLVVKEAEEPLVEATLIGREILCHYLKDCASHLKVFGLDGKFRREFEPNFRCSFDLMSANEKKAVLVASSFGTPYAIFEYSKGKFREIESQEMIKMPVSEDFAISKDGTKIHYFLLGDKNAKKVLIWGYGGYSIPRTPIYDPVYCTLVENGIACVLTNLRGGNEYGEKWHDEGKLYKKQNVFDDYAAVIKKFKDQGTKVVASGRSNGGLLVGATLVQHPELIDAALIGYPVLDMMRFHKLLIGKLWVDEYGDPDNEKDREYLLSYSPYHNLKENVNYPRIMLYTSLHDDRVHPAHAFKFAAKLEETGTAVWLRVQSKGGHAGSSVKTRIEELADWAGFIVFALNS